MNSLHEHSFIQLRLVRAAMSAFRLSTLADSFEHVKSILRETYSEYGWHNPFRFGCIYQIDNINGKSIISFEFCLNPPGIVSNSPRIKCKLINQFLIQINEDGRFGIDPARKFNIQRVNNVFQHDAFRLTIIAWTIKITKESDKDHPEELKLFPPCISLANRHHTRGKNFEISLLRCVFFSSFSSSSSSSWFAHGNLWHSNGDDIYVSDMIQWTQCGKLICAHNKSSKKTIDTESSRELKRARKSKRASEGEKNDDKPSYK